MIIVIMMILLFTYMMNFDSFYNFLLIFEYINLLIKYYFLDPSEFLILK